MTYDTKHEWVCPDIDEVFLITDNSIPIMKVKCVEGTDGEEECIKCLWWGICKKCDICAGPFPCDANQRPDGKYVYFVKVEEY